MVSTRGTENANAKRAVEETDSNVEGDSKRVKVDENGREKGQQTIEEAMGAHGEEKMNGDDNQTKKEKNGDDVQVNGKEQNGHSGKTDEHRESNKKDEEKNAFDEIKSDSKDTKKSSQNKEEDETKHIPQNEANDSVIKDPEREKAMPSSILEKGIIYFFFRARVNIDAPHSVEDVARSHMVLRPLPLGAKIGDGPLEDMGNARLLALPKKVLPKSTQDRFLMFVEKTNQKMEELKEEFLKGSEYATQTVGHTPPVSPLAEGIYAITTTGRESHLAYHITIPSPFPEEAKSVQRSLGLNEKGSYVISAKNPTASGPANTQIDNPAEYPESIMKKFRGRRWMPLEPELLDYEGTQFLIIGEGMGNVEKATQEQEVDKKDEKRDSPAAEMDKLEEEDHARVQHLKGEDKDAVFADLGLSSQDYPKLKTTW